ncbi:MAG: hypothetical protein LBE25_13425 [Arthrobacter sp.]|jgi:hypothetical protein|nr:hypothetical protein [Arthrobacter sp.]
MPDIAAIQRDADERRLIRKIQKAVGFVAPKSVELPESLFSAPGVLVDLATLGFLPIGIVATDGWTFGRETEDEEIEGLGYASAVRTDIVKVTRTVTVTTLETGRKHMQELILGMDLTGVTMDKDTGEIVFDEPDLPINEEMRLLVVGSDGPADALWVLGNGFGAATLTSSGDEVWGKEGAVQRELSFKIAPDDETGSPTKRYVGGSGALAAKEALGFELSTP